MVSKPMFDELNKLYISIKSRSLYLTKDSIYSALFSSAFNTRFAGKADWKTVSWSDINPF